MKVLDAKTIQRYIACANEAFDIANRQNVSESGCVEPEMKKKGARFFCMCGQPVVVINYTLPEMCGCFIDSMYHTVEPEKAREVVYVFGKNGITRNGSPVFDEPWLNESTENQLLFYLKYADFVNAGTPANSAKPLTDMEIAKTIFEMAWGKSSSEENLTIVESWIKDLNGNFRETLRQICLKEKEKV